MFSICATNASGKSGEENEAREGLTHGSFPWGISSLVGLAPCPAETAEVVKHEIDVAVRVVFG